MFGTEGTLAETPNLEWQLAELRRRGLDPRTAICCAPSAGTKGFMRGVAGCQVYQRCPFGKAQFGSFKHTLPHNVPYFIDTREAGVEGVTEMFMPCFQFVRQMMPRMKAGQDAIDNGLDGEVIEILAEGGKLAEKVTMTGFVRTNPGLLPESYARQDKEVPVPPYLYPSEMNRGPISTVREKRRQRLARDPDLQPQNFEGEEMDVPTRPRRGRPPKVKEEWEASAETT